MIPNIDHFILCLTTYCHRYTIQIGGYYFSVTISTRPTNGLFASAKCLLMGDPFNQSTRHVINLDGSWSKVKEIVLNWNLANAGAVT